MRNNSFELTLFDWLMKWAQYVFLAINIKMFGWLYGIAIFASVRFAILKYLKVVHKMELMSGPDQIFFHDDERQCGNIVAYQRIDKFKWDEFRRIQLPRALKFKRMRCRMEKAFGLMFFKEMDQKQLEQDIDKFMIKVTGVHTEQELANFMAKTQAVREPLDHVQWRAYYIEDFSDKESILVFKIHHALADGIAIVLFYSNLMDIMKLEDLPRITAKIGKLQRLYLWATLPFTLLYCAYLNLIALPYQKHCLKTKEQVKNLSMEKNGTFSLDIELALVKKKAKEQGGTLNDLLMAVIGMSIKQYAKKYKKDDSMKQITCTMPFSLRAPPKTVDDFEFDNQFSILPIEMPIEDTYEKALTKAKAIGRSWKNSPIPFALVVFIKLLMLAPSFVSDPLLCDWADRMTFAFSNVPGPQKPYIIGGLQTHILGFFVPALKSLVGGISIMSYVDRIKIGIISDKAVIEKPQDLMGIIHENLDQVLGKEWRDFQTATR